MSLPVERELKYRLTRDEHRRIFSKSRALIFARHIQKNHYFDTKHGLLRRRGIGLRLRVQDGTSVLSVKYGTKSQRPGYTIRVEIESRISSRVARNLIRDRVRMIDLNTAPVRKLRTLVSSRVLSDLRRLGMISTRRVEIRALFGGVIELDKFRIFEDEHYELEMETTRPRIADRNIRAWFRTLGVKHRPCRIPKLGRFFRALGKRNLREMCR
jgi:uncharacterized protein YjbK